MVFSSFDLRGSVSRHKIMSKELSNAANLLPLEIILTISPRDSHTMTVNN